MKTIRIKGISSKGTERVINYGYPSILCKNDFEAITMALRWADDEWTYDYDEKGKRVSDSLFKDFVEITSIEVLDD